MLLMSWLTALPSPLLLAKVTTKQQTLPDLALSVSVLAVLNGRNLN